MPVTKGNVYLYPSIIHTIGKNHKNQDKIRSDCRKANHSRLPKIFTNNHASKSKVHSVMPLFPSNICNSRF